MSTTSTTSLAAEAPWTNVQIEMEPEPTISYRSAMTVYEESLLRGRFVGRGWNGAGYMSFYGDVRLDPAKHASPQAFQIEIDGQLLAAHWEWDGSEQNQTARGLDISKRYKVTWDNSGQTCEVDGFTLGQQGVVVRLEGALTSELLLFEAL